MIRSMTGFGRSQGTLDSLDVAIEIQSVNRRNLETSSSIPREWQNFERIAQTQIRNQLDRGKVHFQIRTTAPENDAGFKWHAEGLESSLRRMGDFAHRHEVKWPPDAATLVQLASLNRVEQQLPEGDAVVTFLEDLFAKALDDLMAMRTAEGAALALDLSSRIQLVRCQLDCIARLANDSVPRWRDLLMQRLLKLGLELDFNDERFLKEIALFADKCDITEEITRLDSHLQQFANALTDGSPVGRKLEFMIQEINREFNTIGSKSHLLEISQCVIEAKTELERLREQILNVE